MKKRILYISPHLDDVVLSCGSLLQEQTYKGYDLYVVTLFTRSNESAKAYYQHRKEDDVRAMKRFKARAIHLDFLDAPFRNYQYRNVSTILFHHHLPLHERKTLRELSKTLQNLLQNIFPHEVYIPLGIGGHIDHHMAFEWSQSLWNQSLKFYYYQDLPYAFIPHWDAIRLQKVGAILNEQVPVQKKGFLQVPFVQNYLDSEEDRLNTLMLYETELNAIHFNGTHRWEMNGMHFVQTSVQATDEKMEAIFCYSTEWPVLFGQKKDQVKEICQYEERYWTQV